MTMPAFAQDEPDDDQFAVRVRGVAKSYATWTSPSARLGQAILHAAGRLPYLPAPAGRWIDRHKSERPRSFDALSGIDIDIRKGESWAFIGLNGSGKSTLLKIISGNLRPTAGRVEVDGKVAILDYSSGLNGEFSGRENVYLKAAALGLTRRQVEERFPAIEAFADIGEFIDRPVKTYSSGMGARLGFAIMAHVDADILISDEALAVGDAFFVQKCMAHIRAFLKRGTFLFVTHSITDVLALCQNAVWLDHGKIKGIGPAKQIADAYLASHALDKSRKYLAREATEGGDPTAGSPRDAGQSGDVDRLRAGRTAVSLSAAELSARAQARPPRVVRDPRIALLNQSSWRNDIEIPAFDPTVQAEGFGVGGARIVDVAFEDDSGCALSWVIGAEVVCLIVTVEAERDLAQPIIGFQVKDRFGQTLFADNTYLVTLDQPFRVPAGHRFAARFRFQLPLLPVGDYVIRAAVASGSESDNAMMHCLDNALVFRCVTSGMRHGLVGVPMLRVGLELVDPVDANGQGRPVEVAAIGAEPAGLPHA